MCKELSERVMMCTQTITIFIEPQRDWIDVVRGVSFAVSSVAAVLLVVVLAVRSFWPRQCCSRRR